MMILAILFLLLLPSSLQAATYWADSSGGAANCAAASGSSDPGVYRTLTQGMACLSGGDTLMLKAGTYTSVQINACNIANGSNFTTGTTKITGAGKDSTFLVGLTSGSDQDVIAIASNCGKQFLEFSHIDIEAPNGYGVRFDFGASIRMTNFRIHNSAYQNLAIYGGGPYEMTDFISSHAGIPNGTPDCHGTTPQGGYCHGFYIQASNVTLDRCVSHDNNGGNQFYPTPTNGIIRNCVIHNNRSQQVGGDAVTGLWIGGASNIEVYNNTFYNNEARAIWCFSSSSVTIKNNILWNNALLNDCSAIATNNLTANPSYVSSGTEDFHLQSGSAAIGCGADLGSLVPADKDGLARPQGASWDCGAYEFVEDTTGRDLASGRTNASGRAIASGRTVASGRQIAE